MKIEDWLAERHRFEGYEKRTVKDEYGVPSTEYIYVRDYYYVSGGNNKHLLRKVLYSVFFVLSLVAQAAAGIQKTDVNYALYVNIFQALALISCLPLAVYLYHYISSPYKMELHHYMRSHKRLISLSQVTSALLGAAVISMIVRLILSAASQAVTFIWTDIICIVLYIAAFFLPLAISLIEKRTAYIIQPSEYK